MKVYSRRLAKTKTALRFERRMEMREQNPPFPVASQPFQSFFRSGLVSRSRLLFEWPAAHLRFCQCLRRKQRPFRLSVKNVRCAGTEEMLTSKQSTLSSCIALSSASSCLIVKVFLISASNCFWAILSCDVLSNLVTLLKTIIQTKLSIK